MVKEIRNSRKGIFSMKGIEREKKCEKYLFFYDYTGIKLAFSRESFTVVVKQFEYRKK